MVPYDACMRPFHLLALLFVFVELAVPGAVRGQGSGHSATDWQLKPSLKYDALCLLNSLGGDPYYLRYYRKEYEHFHRLFTPAEQNAFIRLKRILKDEGHGIISAKLALYFSTVGDETLPEMIRTAHESSAMKLALEKTEYWDEGEWRNYEAARPALEDALKALDRVGFAAYWEANAKPRIEKRIAELTRDLPRYDIVGLIEADLGFRLPSHAITVYLLAYSEPHGIRITGLRFLTHESYPFEIVLHNAVHESMHPPYHLSDPGVQDAIHRLEQDSLVVDKVRHHDPSFGYNTAAGYIEEDSVQALEQLICEKLGVGRNPCKYWREQDGGMHVLAAALYDGYKQAQSKQPRPYSRWLVEAVGSGELLGRRLQSKVERFFADPSCAGAE